MTFSFQKLQITSSFSSWLAHSVCTRISCFGPRSGSFALPGRPCPCCPHGPLLVTTHGWQGFPSSRQHSLHKPSSKGLGNSPFSSLHSSGTTSIPPNVWFLGHLVPHVPGPAGNQATEGVRTQGFTWLLPLAPCLVLCLRLLISKTGTHKDSCVSGVWHDQAGQWWEQTFPCPRRCVQTLVPRISTLPCLCSLPQPQHSLESRVLHTLLVVSPYSLDGTERKMCLEPQSQGQGAHGGKGGSGQSERTPATTANDESPE